MLDPGIISDLEKGMKGYSPELYRIAGDVAKALQPIGLAILMLLFIIELQNVSRKAADGGGLSIEVMSNIAMKYIVALAFVMASSMILNAVLWFGIQVIKWTGSVVTQTDLTFGLLDMKGVKGFVPKAIAWGLIAITHLLRVFLNLIAAVMVIFRFVQLYLYKSIAPILVAFYLNDETKSISIGFFKQFGAHVLQGALLILISGLAPAIMGVDLEKFVNSSGFDAFGIFLMSAAVAIVKVCYLIFLIIGSAGFAKRLVGAN